MLVIIGALVLTQVPEHGVRGPAIVAQKNDESPPEAGQPDVIITKRRGDAEVPAETEFEEGDIAADGSDTVQELLSNLQAFIDPTGNQPVILVNGKPIGFDRSILAYPAKALVRVQVLQPNAAHRYGAQAGVRVVNIVLKSKFASLETEVASNAATAGGQFGGSVGVTRTAIKGDTRWNARGLFGRQQALLKSARRIPQLVDELGSAGEEGVAGRAFDPGDFETLQPSIRNATLGLNVARTIGNIAASFTLDRTSSTSNGLHGIPSASLLLPEDSSSLSGGAIVTVAGSRALRSTSRTQTLGASVTLTGVIRGVQTSLAASFSNSDARDRIETGIDVARLQEWIGRQGAGIGLSSTHVDSFLNSRQGRSRSNNVNLRLSLQKSLLTLPAGPLSWSFTAARSSGNSNVLLSGSMPTISGRSAYAQSAFQLSVSVPISSQGSQFEAFRDLTVDLSLGGQSGTGRSATTGFGGGLSWEPLRQVQIRGSMDISQTAPSFDQINGSVASTVTRVFDYSRGEFADPIWTTGGNPLLKSGRQTAATLAMIVRPFARRDLALKVGYRQTVAIRSPAAFPELTPAIEMAFPGRVTRNSEGRLLAVDARPISIERQEDARFTSSLTLRLGGRARRRSGEVPRIYSADRLQFNLALNYQLRLKSDTLISGNMPVINRLIDSEASRHEMDIRIGVGKRSWGGSLSTSWNSPTRVRINTETYRLTPPTTINISTHIDLHGLLKGTRAAAWANGLKLSFDIQNLLRDYRRIGKSGSGLVSGYSREESDPLGRTIHLGLRRQF